MGRGGALTWLGLASAFGLAAACIGEDPGVAGLPPDSGAPPEAGTAPDGSDDGASGDGGVTCLPTPPNLFAPVPDAGPFCNGAPNDHCRFGDHCCRDLTLNTMNCAATCTSGADIACLSAAECPAGSSCCATGTPRTDVCSYAVVQGLTRSTCSPVCSNEVVLCANTAQCGSKTCVPARALTPSGDATSLLQLGACL